MLVRSIVPLAVTVAVFWASAGSHTAPRRLLLLLMTLPVLLAITFEEYSEERWGVRSSDDLTTVFNARLVDAIPVSVFDLVVVAALVASVAYLGPAAILRALRGSTRGLRAMLALAAAALVYGALSGLVRLTGSDDRELLHVLREARPLALALAGLALVGCLVARDRAAARPVAWAVAAGIIARAAIGAIRHATGGGRWYQGDRMVYFDGTDSVLFLAALGMVAVVVIRSRRASTVWLGFLAAAPLAYALVFSYRRSVWIGAVAALLVVAVTERRTLTMRPRLLVGAFAAALVLTPVALTQTDPSFVVSRVQSIVDLDDEPSNAFRIHDLRNGLHDIAAHRGLGAGFGGRAEIVSTTPDQAEFIEHVNRTNHNSAIYLVMKMGVLGAAAWLALLLATVARAFRRSEDATCVERDCARVLGPVLIAAGVASMFLPLAYNVRPMLLWSVAAGVLWADTLAAPDAEHRRTPPKPAHVRLTSPGR